MTVKVACQYSSQSARWTSLGEATLISPRTFLATFAQDDRCSRPGVERGTSWVPAARFSLLTVGGQAGAKVGAEAPPRSEVAPLLRLRPLLILFSMALSSQRLLLHFRFNAAKWGPCPPGGSFRSAGALSSWRIFCFLCYSQSGGPVLPEALFRQQGPCPPGGSCLIRCSTDTVGDLSSRRLRLGIRGPVLPDPLFSNQVSSCDKSI